MRSIQRYWLSFCHLDKPVGQKFAGGVIMPGVCEHDALRAATRLGLNPGGQCAYSLLPEWLEIDPNLLFCVLDKQESKAFCDYIDAAFEQRKRDGNEIVDGQSPPRGEQCSDLSGTAMDAGEPRPRGDPGPRD
jgi:hypothetical protein